jgi:hypothetical protein
MDVYVWLHILYFGRSVPPAHNSTQTPPTVFGAAGGVKGYESLQIDHKNINK